MKKKLPLAPALLVALFVARAHALPQQVWEAPPTWPDPRTFEHRYGGLVYDVFTLDGEEMWTAEDGGRIRHRTVDASGDVSWNYQPRCRSR